MPCKLLAREVSDFLRTAVHGIHIIILSIVLAAPVVPMSRGERSIGGIARALCEHKIEVSGEKIEISFFNKNDTV